MVCCKHKQYISGISAPQPLGTMHPIYIEQMYRYSPEYTFYIFSQQIYLIIFLDFLSPSSFMPPQMSCIS